MLPYPSHADRPAYLTGVNEEMLALIRDEVARRAYPERHAKLEAFRKAASVAERAVEGVIRYVEQETGGTMSRAPQPQAQHNHRSCRCLYQPNHRSDEVTLMPGRRRTRSLPSCRCRTTSLTTVVGTRHHLRRRIRCLFRDAISSIWAPEHGRGRSARPLNHSLPRNGNTLAFAIPLKRQCPSIVQLL